MTDEQPDVVDHKAKVAELAERLAVEHARILDRLARGDTASLDEESETRGTGWCAPSP